MGEQVQTDRVLTVPNVLSMLRLVGVPAFLWAILTHRDGLALILLMETGITDYSTARLPGTTGSSRASANCSTRSPIGSTSS
jgi:cardiolipin synthase